MKRTITVRTVMLVTIAVALAVLAIAGSWPGPPERTFWFWVAACFVGELLWVRLPVGGATLSMASACNFAALLLLSRGEAMLATAAAGLLAEAVVMRKPTARYLYNAGQGALAVGAGSLVYHWLAGPGAMGVGDLVGAGLVGMIAAAAMYTVINTGAVSVAVGLTEGVSVWRAWRANFGTRYELLSNSALFSLGASLAVLYVVAGPVGTGLVTLPLLLAYEGYRRHAGATERAAAVEARAA